MGDPAKPGGYGQSGRPPMIKNKNAAAIQITAEQLIREAYDRQGAAQKAPRQKVLDGEELSDYQMRRRREFEEGVRKNKHNIGEWIRYASWEEGQNEVARARSIYERALEIDGRNQTLYIKYAELEMKHKNINSARNLYDRAVTILPRVSQFWYRYTLMEETLGNIDGARDIFDRWMRWEPEEDAWTAYIKFEKRYNEIDNARTVLERFVHVHPQPKSWLRWTSFEEELGEYDRVREVYGMAIDRLGEEFIDQHVFISFAKFEARLKEYERARAIYKYALERLPKSKSQALYNQYTLFEKQYGDRQEIETVVATKRRMMYEATVKNDPHDYDAWLDYARLEEEEATSSSDPESVERTRDVYERAIAEHPLVAEKRLWRRYIYLWLNYALFEETVAQDTDRARQVYLACNELLPHKTFTFAKFWLQYAWFEIRQLNVAAARRALGVAIGKCPKDRLFRGYIEMELELREFERVRVLYSKYLEFNPTNCTTWVEFAKLEMALGESDRCQALFDLAVDQPTLDMPEVLWKAYIDFSYDLGDFEKTRSLYTRLLTLTDHVKVWISLAQFEYAVCADTETKVMAARQVYERAYKRLKQLGRKEERLALLEAWGEVEAEDQAGDSSLVESKMPKRVRKRRELDDGTLEEYFDYVFPDDEEQGARFKLLAKAHLWKQRAKESEGADSEPKESSDNGQKESDSDSDS
ncbi:NineTeen Complex (NTC) component [Coemansia sp. RSA 1722]|nr:NineTeen Complex (NTC) component [Coemansia sp. RSA 486]KAJ2238053.1 NineTeen Complex (NTC) component [Coemansia sp. RSA 485]KAJ2603587.1 NineTeen Complex (NTC) component [Coemansia sp. RSA 1721]KAJ2606190.1 NineTeen Complex (NTC) component [Coemansia sp. RSA 1722]KAJ2639687.1 NineTeen Complex (NTC) component [Coemansia sp. RSA 1286]